MGAYHGINPAMGWLFAVALGLQEQSRRSVLAAFAPIAIGHAASIAIVIAVLTIGRTVLPLNVLKYSGAFILISFGAYKLLRASHPRWVGMRVGFRDLTWWSFLMSSAHGAGLMLLPVLFNLPGYADTAAAIDARDVPHAEFMLLGAPPSIETITSQLTALAIHTAAMFGVMAAVAIIVFEKLGVAILRRSWFDLDRLWAIAVIVAGIATLAIPI